MVRCADHWPQLLNFYGFSFKKGQNGFFFFWETSQPLDFIFLLRLGPPRGWCLDFLLKFFF